ncbi:MAG TPA: hypothetical protein VM864_15510 [Pyrinomonadaceae bacterium]|jgi:hypothetical protein|nr:hypothetical protein [Pyrinomonadaceae bacterium]
MDERDEFDEELIIDDEPSGVGAEADDSVAGGGYLSDDEDGEGDDAGDEDGEEDEEDEDDEDEDAEVRTALLSKHEMIALISLRTSAEGGGRIVRVDPRQPLPAAKVYEDPADALRWFRRSLATSRRNGWEVVYDGEPRFG